MAVGKLGSVLYSFYIGRMLRAAKVRLFPIAEEVAFLNRQLGAVRFVRNKALAIKVHRYRVHGQTLSAKHDLKKLLAVAKRSRRYAWLSDYDSKALQQACIDLEKAFRNFFEGRAGFPRFKRKHGEQSSYHCSGKIGYGADWIQLPKMKTRIRAVIHRPITGELKSITIRKTVTGKYFASILVEDGLAKPDLAAVIPEEAIIGADAGVIDLLTESTGRKTENPRFLKRSQRNLRRKQKTLSRKEKGSKNRAKARLKVAKAHERSANAKEDFQHKLSKRLVDENQAIIVETLAVKNMLKNRGLAKAISDAGWSGLIRKIGYKAERSGKHLVKIDRWAATSKTCSCCGHKLEELDLAVRRWTCEACGAEHDRDENAALNIKRLGILKLRAGGWHVPVCGGLHQTVQATAAAYEAESIAA